MIKKNVSQRVCTVEDSSTTSIVTGWICKCSYVRVSSIASTLCQYRYTHAILLSRQSIFRSHWTYAASWVVISSPCLEVWDFCCLSSCVSSSWSYESSDLTSSQSKRTILQILNQTLWLWFWMRNWDTSRLAALRDRRCYGLSKFVLSTLNRQSLAFADTLDVWWHRVTEDLFFNFINHFYKKSTNALWNKIISFSVFV